MGAKFRLPTEIPIEEYPEPQVFVDEAIRLVHEAENRGITIRVIGGLAIYLQCTNYRDFFMKIKRLGDKVFTDIDFVTLNKYSSRLLNFFTDMGYKYDPRILYLHPSRLIFFAGKVPMVDVFLDKLEMCHTIDLRNRLEIHSLTIPPSDLLLEKLQIVKINEKDMKDVLYLLKCHEVGDHDNVINLNYIAKLLADDWGFYYTVTSNLVKIRDQYMPSCEFIAEEEKNNIFKKIDRILAVIEKTPKTLKWKLNAKIGTRRRWYREVEEIL